MSGASAVFSAPAPKTAVFLSYQGIDPTPDLKKLKEVTEVFRIAGRISSSGATLFLGEACMRPPAPEKHVLNALGFADELLILVTPTPEEYLKKRRVPAFLDGPVVWLAIGVACYRDIQIRGLLKGLAEEEVKNDPDIPTFIKDRLIFQTVDSYLKDLQRSRKAPAMPIRPPGLQCRLCLCQEGRNSHPNLDEQLLAIGFDVNPWRPKSKVDGFEAAVVVPSSEPSEAWNASGLPFLENFVRRGKPAALFAARDAQVQPEILDILPVASRVQYSGADDISFLQLVWTLVGYEQYPSGIEPLVIEPPTTNSGAEVITNQRSGVFVSYSHDDQKWHDMLLRHLAPWKQQGMEIWTDRQIKPGDQWHKEIQDRLNGTQVAVLLVTPAFFDSPYISSQELPNVLVAAKTKGLRIFWIPVSDSSWKATQIAEFQAAHDPAGPLDGLSGAERAKAWVKIVTKLAGALKQR